MTIRIRKERLRDVSFDRIRRDGAGRPSVDAVGRFVDGSFRLQIGLNDTNLVRNRIGDNLVCTSQKRRQTNNHVYQ